jgi:hypothetical protein
MNDELPERELLRMIDPAPRTISDDDRMRNLRRVLERIDVPPARGRAQPSRRLRLLTRVVLPIGLAAAAVAVAVPLALDPSRGGPDGGTATAQPGAVLVGSTTDAGVRILADTTVGSAQFLLGERGGDIRFGASFAGSDPDDSWETFGPTQAVADDGFTVVNPGNFPDAAPNGIATVTGQVGADVVGLDIRTHTGDIVGATLVDGFYIAAWNGHDFDGPDTPDAEFILHLAGGSTRTIPYAEASP